VKTVIHKLRQLGLSEYEAKAYFALLKENPLTAYEIAKKSGIPTSKVYEVIKRLEGRQAVQSIHGEHSRMFIPASPEELIQNYRSVMEDNLCSVKHELSDIKGGMDTSYTWHIREYEGFILKARRMVDTAVTSLLLMTWPSEMAPLLSALENAAARGVKIAVVHYGPARTNFGQVYIHPVEDTIYEQKGARGFTLVADAKEALNCKISGRETEAIWSMNEGFVIMAESYICHDIYQMKTMKRLAPLLKEKFGEHYEKMRDVYNDND